MCPGWPRHSAWVSGPGEPASPRLEACTPVGLRRLWAGLAGTARCQGPPALTLTFSGHPARGGQLLRLGRGQVQGARALPRHSDSQWAGGKVTHSPGVRWPANLEVSLGPAQDIEPLARTKGCGLGCYTPGSGLQAPASLPAVARSEIRLLPPGPAGRGPSLVPARAGKLSPPAPRESLPGRTPLPRGGGERAPRGRDDAGRAPPRRPAQIAFKTSASPPPTAGQGAGAGRGGRRRHVPPRRPAPRSLSCPPNSGPTFSISGVGLGLGTLGSCQIGIFTSTASSPV